MSNLSVQCSDCLFFIRYKNLKETEAKKEITILRLLIPLMFLVNPALIMMSQEKAEYKRKLLKDKCQQRNASFQKSDLEKSTEWKVQESDIIESKMLSEFLNECRLALLTFRRNELSLELVAQLTIHLAMVLLNQTKYPVESGLETIFKSSIENEENSSSALFFLVLSVLWSFKTSALTSIKIKTATKNFLPIFPKVILGVRYLLVFITRIGSNVAYFSPFIGLLGIMNHYHAEQIHLSTETLNSFNPECELIVTKYEQGTLMMKNYALQVNCGN